MRDKGIIGSFHPAGKLFFLFLLIFISVSITSFIGMLVAIPFWEFSFHDLLDGTFTENISGLTNFNKYLQSISHLGLFIIPAFIFAWLVQRNFFKYFRFNNKPDLRQVFLGICVIFASLPLINFLVEINMELSLPPYLKSVEIWMINAEEAAMELTEEFLSVKTPKGLIINIIVIAVIPAIGEELIFRGVLLRTLKQWTNNSHIAVWISAILFSAMHIQFFGFLPRLFLGVLFGYLVVYSGSLWIAMIAHFVNNAAAVIAYYYYHNNLTKLQLDEIGTGESSSYFIVLSVLLLSIFMFAYWKIGKDKETGSEHFLN